MPEETKKGSKGKGDPKEQRRKRQGRQPPAPVEKKVEKPPEAPKVSEPEKPAYVPPGPEFYQSLKRETDEILKITEEANSKYKKKEIQSNWAKYEMPIETYEEIDEQENLGADYEALIQASFSVGGHFQFKHEKSWDITSGPTPFDKYFEINMESLNTALSTIPFYERNNMDLSLFSESDIQTMDHRATKFKQKYYNDKKYTTPDLEAGQKILKSLIGSSSNIETSETSNNDEDNMNSNNVRDNENLNELKAINLEQCEPVDINCDKTVIDLEYKESKEVEEKEIARKNETHINETNQKNNQSKTTITQETENNPVNKKSVENKVIDNDFDTLQSDLVAEKVQIQPEIVPSQVNAVPKEIELPKAPKDYPINLPKEPPKNPVIESPEDLEKWLDDFLDG